MILVSHALGTVLQMCDQAAWIEKGSLKQVGAVDEVISAYNTSIFPVAAEFQGAFESKYRSDLGLPIGHRE